MSVSIGTPTIPWSGKTLMIPCIRGSDGKPSYVISYTPNPSQFLSWFGATGTVTLTFGGHTTTALGIGAPASGVGSVQSALEALPSVGVGNVIVTGVFIYQVVWQNALALTSQVPITVNTGGLSSSVAAVALTAGTSAEVDQDASGANFTKSGIWSTLASGSGSAFAATTIGDGLTYAQYRVPGLVQGNYELILLFPGSINTTGYVTALKARLMDGNIYRGFRTVNQASPSNVINFPGIGGLSGQSIGTVFVSTGDTLSVTINDDVTGSDIGKPIYAGYLVVRPIDPAATKILNLISNMTTVIQIGSWANYNDTGNWNNLQSYELASQSGGTTKGIFYGLMPGTYKSQVNWNKGAGIGDRTTHAQWQGFDGSISLGNWTINQTLSPTGGLTEIDSQPASFTFQPVNSSAGGGLLTITSTTSSYIITGQSDFTTNAGVLLMQLQVAAGYSESVTSTSSTLVSGPISIKVNGGISISLNDVEWGLQPSDPTLFNQDLALEYLGALLPSTLLNTDVITVTVPSGVVKCVDGNVPGVTDMAVVNKVGLPIVSLPANTVQPLQYGMNIFIADTGSSAVSLSANQCKRNQVNALQYNGPESPAPPVDVNGYPQVLKRGDYNFSLGAVLTNPIDPKRYYVGPASGTWQVLFDGAFGEIEVSGGLNTNTSLSSLNTGNSTHNVIKVSISTIDSSTYSPTPTINLNCMLVRADDMDIGRSSSTGTWTLHTVAANAAFNGGYHSGDSLSSSVWTFKIGPAPNSTYDIGVYWPATAGASTNTTITAKLGATILATATGINQRNAPAGPFLSVQDANGNSYSALLLYSGTTGDGSTDIKVELHGDTSGPAIADAAYCVLTGTLGSRYTPITNLRVFDPSINLASPIGPLDYNGEPKFHPQALYQLYGSRCLRFIENSIPTVNFSDYATGHELSNVDVRQKQWVITNIDNWNDPGGYWAITYANSNVRVAALITVDPTGITTSPFSNGVCMFLAVTANFGIGASLAPLSSTGYFQLGSYLVASIIHDPAHMSANQFAIYGYANGTGTSGSPPVLNPASPVVSQSGSNLGTVTFYYTGIPLQDKIDLTNYIDSQNVANGLARCDMWFVSPQGAVPSLFTSVFAALGNSSTGLNPGLKVMHEFSNEAWNTGFPQFFYFSMQSIKLAPDDGYAALATIAHDNAIPAWTGAGRNRSDYIAGYGDQFGQDFHVQACMDYCHKYSKPFDAGFVAPYMGNYPAGFSQFVSLYAKMNIPQVMDFYAAKIAFSSQFQDSIKASHDAIKNVTTGFPSAQLFAYECSTNIPALEWGNSFDGGNDNIASLQAWGAHFSSRMCLELIPGYIKMAQDSGMTNYYMWYNSAQVLGPLSGTAPIVMYAQYMAWNSLRGIGNGTDSLHNNDADIGNGAGLSIGIPNQLLAVTPIAKGVLNWNSLGVGAATGYLTTPSGTIGGSFGVPITIGIQANGVPSTALVITPAVSPNDGSFGGLIGGTLTINDNLNHNITWTPGANGSHAISFTHTGGGFAGNDPANITVNVAGPATLYSCSPSGTIMGSVGVPISFTLQANAVPSIGLVITPAMSPNDGTFGGLTGGTLTINDANAYVITWFTNVQGLHTLSFSHTGGGFGGDPANVIISVGSSPFTPHVKSRRSMEIRSGSRGTL